MISESDLLLYYYRDGLDSAERERIAAALIEQPELAARLHRLVARLDAAAMTPEVPVPAQVQQRWQAALSRVAKGEVANAETPRRELFASSRWRMTAVAAAGVLLIVSAKVTLQFTPSERGSPMQTAAIGVNDPLAYERGLRLHLANTEFQLASLDTASTEQRIELIETIIAQNRLYAIAAERASEPQLARVLRAFTPILEGLAEEDDDEAAGEIAQLNFELNVIQARLTAATSTESTAQSVAL